MFMSDAEAGIYIRLMCAQHQHGGRISKDDFDSMVGDNKKLRGKFKLDDLGYYNERLEHEISRRKRDADASRDNGKKGGRPPVHSKQQVKKPKENLKQTRRFENHNLTENENETINVTKDEAKTETSLHSKFRATFEEIYQRKRELKYVWSAKDGFAIKQLIGRIEGMISEKSDEARLEFWRTLLEHLPDWYVTNGFSPSVINSKINEIVSKINKPHGANNSTIDRQVDEILKRGNPYA